MLGEVKTRRRVNAESGLNVRTAAEQRIAWLFDEFDGNVTVATSGGKDSTVVMELAAAEARSRGQRLRVYFLDQEAEWQSTRDYQRKVADRDDIDFEWYQIPFRLFNATSFGQEWGQMWPSEPPEGGWVREPEPDAIRTNDLGTDRFKEVMEVINRRHGGALLSGMRIEESPNRRMGSTVSASYKWITWAARFETVTRRQREAGLHPYWMFHPIYDWSYRDVWHAIETGGWTYNSLYDEMFRYGVRVRDMRVSSLVHTGSLASLPLVQEIEPDTWQALVRRFPGINSYGHVGATIEEEYQRRRPYMFDTWCDYFSHLVNTLAAPEHQAEFWSMHDDARRDVFWVPHDEVDRQMVSLVLRNNHFRNSAYAKWLLAQWQKEGKRRMVEEQRSRA